MLLSGEESDGPRSSWIFHEVESGIFEIENAVNRNWFLGQADQAQDQTESLNVQLTEADAPDSPPAKWILHHIDHGMYYVENADHPGMYLSHPSEESRDSNIRNVKLASEDDPDWNRSIWMLAGVDQ